MIEKHFVSAVVLSPFALDGFVKVRSLSGETEHLLRLSSVVLRGKSGERAYEIEKSLVIDGVPAHILVKFKNIDTPEAAKTLSGSEILLSRLEAAPLAADEYYIEDLKGLRVVDIAGETLGEVSGILEGGGGQLLEMRLAPDVSKLIPFRNEFFGEIDLKKNEITLLAVWILE
ncbi:MAG: ribosome maturation factor RimM [Spirochaetaceae bacterium]|nr:ribosome maturation factor RimM [Spirochaetaceae bacterium]